MTIDPHESPVFYEFQDPFGDISSPTQGSERRDDSHPYRSSADPRPRPSPERLKKLAQEAQRCARLAELAYMESAARESCKPIGARSSVKKWLTLPRLLLVAGCASAFGAFVGVAGTYTFYKPPAPRRVEVHHAAPAHARISQTRPQHRRAAVPAARAAASVQMLDDYTWRIAKPDLAQLYRDLLLNNTTVRFVPHQPNGATVGLKVFGVRRNSTLDRLGFQNGDLLMAVNGLSIVDAEELGRALSVESDVFAVLLERRGDARIQVYRVTP